jgi:hypothetical protein
MIALSSSSFGIIGRRNWMFYLPYRIVCFYQLYLVILARKQLSAVFEFQMPFNFCYETSSPFLVVHIRKLHDVDYSLYIHTHASCMIVTFFIEFA